MDQIQATGSTLDPDTAADMNQTNALRMAQSFGGDANDRMGMFNILNGVANSSTQAQKQRLATLSAQQAMQQLTPQGDNESDLDYSLRSTKAQRDAAMQYSPDMASQLNTRLLLLGAQKQEQAKLAADTSEANSRSDLTETQSKLLATSIPLADKTKNLAYIASVNPNSALGYNLKPYDLSTAKGSAAYTKDRMAPNTTVLTQADASKLMIQSDVAHQRAAIEQIKLAVTMGSSLSQEALQYATYQVMANPSVLRSLSGMGQGGQLVRKQIMENVAAVAKHNGIAPQDLASMQAQIHAESGSITGLTKMMNNVTAYETLMHNNGDRLLALIGNVDTTGVPAFEGAIRWAKAHGGNVDTNELRSVLNSFQQESARILSSPNLSGQLTEGAKKDMQSVIGGNLDAPSMVRIIHRLYTEGEVRRTGIANEITNAGQMMGGLLGGSGFGNGVAPPQGGGNVTDWGSLK